ANLRSPVRLSAPVRRLMSQGNEAFLEVGPSTALLSAVRDDADGAGRTCTLVPSMRAGESERASMLTALAGLYGSGQTIAWEQLYPWGSQPVVAAPTYPWQRQRYWLGDGLDVVPPPS